MGILVGRHYAAVVDYLVEIRGKVLIKISSGNGVKHKRKVNECFGEGD